jgi:hypothetical protein
MIPANHLYAHRKTRQIAPQNEWVNAGYDG